MSLLGDEFIGSSDLPHVYCKKILVENHEQHEHKIKITLNLVLYEEANLESKSVGWLKQFITTTGGTNASQGFDIFDYMYLHVQATDKINLLKPSYFPDNYKSVFESFDGDTSTESASLGLGNIYYAHTALKAKNALNIWWPYQINLNNKRESAWAQGKYSLKSSLNLSKDTVTQSPSLLTAFKKSQITQEVINGKPYYVTPYQFTMTTFKPGFQGNPLVDPTGHLGFMFYTFLDTKGFFEDLIGDLIDVNTAGDYIQQHMIQGTVNSEVVYENTKLAQKRQEFFLPNGKIWEGPAHLHYCDINPDPTGYCGTGAVGSSNGWMVGKEHTMNPNVQQSKLDLQKFSNYKIDNFVSKSKMTPMEDNFGVPISPSEMKNETFRKWKTDTGLFFSQVLSPFQKENRKDFIKDNDSEYSKLFLTRDFIGTCRGFFFINYQELLKNNSQLFTSLSLDAANRSKVLNNSKVLELKIYRDRVNRHNPSIKNQEKFKNDSFYEEASTLVASISDNSIFGNIKKLYGFDSTNKYGFYTFDDPESVNLEAGRYQYRIVLNFKDGTYKYLKGLLQNFIDLETDMNRYHELSKNSFSEEELLESGPAPGGLEFSSFDDPEEKRKYFTPYYDEYLGFNSRFKLLVDDLFGEGWTSKDGTWVSAETVWDTALVALWTYLSQLMLDDSLKSQGDIAMDFQNWDIYFTMVHPVTGSPQGIEYVIKALRMIIDKLLELTGAGKLGSPGIGPGPGSDLTINNSVTLTDLYSNAEPASSIIQEYHSFDDADSLFIATASKGVWVDYLTSGINDLTTNHIGLKEITIEKYLQHCQFDAQKFINPPNLQDTATGEVKYHADIESHLYRFLTPSIIHYMDPTGIERRVYDYYTFDEAQTNATDFVTILVRFADHIQRKLKTEFADIIEPFSALAHGANVPFFEGHHSREAAKAYIEQLNITVHTPSNYSKFFDKRPGAVNLLEKTPEEWYNIGAPYKGDPLEWSDTYLQTADFIINFIYSPWQKLLKMGRGRVNTNLENPPLGYYLIDLYLNNPNSLLQMGQQYTNTFKKMLSQSPTSVQRSSYAFFMLNMTMTVERLTPPTGPAKDSDGNWVPLTRAYLKGLSSGRKVFCRMKFWNKGLAEGGEVPILDQYFLINESPTPSFISTSPLLLPLIATNKFKKIIKDLKTMSDPSTGAGTNVKPTSVVATAGGTMTSTSAAMGPKTSGGSIY